MPSLADLFLACKGFSLFVFLVLIFGFLGFEGLTCDFWAEMTKSSRSVAWPFGLRSCLRQSGRAFGLAFLWHA